MDELSLTEKILELRKEGKSYTDIMAILNCKLLTIQKACNRNGVIKHNITELSPDKIEEIRRVYAETNSQRKTAKIVGYSKTTVAKYASGYDYYRIRPKTSVENVVNWRRRTKEKLVQYKGGCCQAPGCGYNKCIEALNFHHLDPSQKDFHISGKSWSFERLKEEVDKCMLLCSNCHKEVHAGILILD